MKILASGEIKYIRAIILQIITDHQVIVHPLIIIQKKMFPNKNKNRINVFEGIYTDDDMHCMVFYYNICKVKNLFPGSFAIRSLKFGTYHA